MSWFAILRHAPAILAAADAAIRRRRARVEDPARSLDARLDDLVQETREMARQLEALVALNRETTRQARIAIIVAATSLTIAAVAVVVAIAR